MLPLSSAKTKLWVGENQPRSASRNSCQLLAWSTFIRTPRSWLGMLPAHHTEVVWPRSEMTGPWTLQRTFTCWVVSPSTGMSNETVVYGVHLLFQRYMPG